MLYYFLKKIIKNIILFVSFKIRMYYIIYIVGVIEKDKYTLLQYENEFQST